jgi:hypothetical protein
MCSIVQISRPPPAPDKEEVWHGRRCLQVVAAAVSPRPTLGGQEAPIPTEDCWEERLAKTERACTWRDVCSVKVQREKTQRNGANDSLVWLQCGRPTYIQGEGVCWGDTSSPTDTSWEASLPIQLITCFISQHSPLINSSSVYCNPKTPPKKPCGKNWGEIL